MNSQDAAALFVFLTRLILLDIAIVYESGTAKGRYLRKRFGAEKLLGKERLADLQKLGSGPNAAKHLKAHEAVHAKQRKAAGFAVFP